MEEKNTYALDEQLKGIKSEKQLEKFLEEIEGITPDTGRFPPATAYFRELLDNVKGISITELSERGGLVSKDYIYKIYNGKKTNPSREIWIGMACAMQATVEETNKLLKYAGLKELYPKNKSDAIIIYGLNQGMDIYQIQEIFENRGIPSMFDEN